MSLQSQLTANDAIVLGHGWLAALAASELGEAGLRTSLIRPESPPSFTLPAYMGNGECWGKARAIYGEDLAAALWSVSQESLTRAEHMGGEVAMKGQARWIAESADDVEWLSRSLRDREAIERGTAPMAGVLRTPCVKIDFDRLDHGLCAKVGSRGGAVIDAHIDEIQGKGSDRAIVRLRVGDEAIEASAPVLVVTETPLATKWVPWLVDKWIFATLSSFICPAANSLPAMMCFWHLGADFAVRQGASHWLGSFRSLHADNAVGVKQSADEKARAAVLGFFGERGWLDSGVESNDRLGLAALSCDGVPIVGTVPSLPNVYVMGGFAGRPQNFAFSVSRRLARAIEGKTGFDGLSMFSSRRFV